MKPLAKKLREIRNKHFPPRLEFGCEVVVKKLIGFDDVAKNIVIRVNEKNGNYIYTTFMGDLITVCLANNLLKILGRPTTLEEVLMIFKKKRCEKNPNFEFGIMADTYILTDLLDSIDLSRPLEQQDDEVLEQIIKLSE